VEWRTECVYLGIGEVVKKVGLNEVMILRHTYQLEQDLFALCVCVCVCVCVCICLRHRGHTCPGQVAEEAGVRLSSP
jgi:hypothetical protein